VILSAVTTRIPGLDCAVPLGFVAVLLGVAVMSLGETMLGAAVAGIVQTIWPRRCAKAGHVAFDTGLLLASTWIAHTVAHAAAPGSPALRVVAGVLPLYFFNAGAVTGLLSFVNGNLDAVCDKFQFAVLPRYIMGAVFAALLADRDLVSSGWMPLLPAAALVHWLFSESGEGRMPFEA